MKYYITRTVGNVTLYFDGEQFQQSKTTAQIYLEDEARQIIEAENLQYAELTPYYYDPVGYITNQIFPS